MSDAILTKIDQALARIEPYAEQDLYQAESIRRQLLWCRGQLRGEDTEPAPGPLTMGLIATREFDMYGNEPDLARLINEIEKAAQAAGLPIPEKKPRR